MKRSEVEDIVQRAAGAFNAGRSDDARRLCEQGLGRVPDDPTLNHLMAAMLFASGAADAAAAHIATCLRARPDHMPARLLAARIARARQDHAGALTHLDAALRDGTTAALLIERARIIDHFGDGAGRRDAWRAALDADPHCHEAMARLGRLLWEDGDAATAARLLARAVTTDAPASAWFDLGLARQDLRDHSGAAAAYAEALARKPDYAEAAVNLGVARQETGDIDGALKAYATAYRLRASTFGAIAMALTSAPHGRIWLDESELRRALGD